MTGNHSVAVDRPEPAIGRPLAEGDEVEPLIGESVIPWCEGSKELRNLSSRLVFIGSTPNIGTTVISFGCAVRLALETGAKVGYICLNLKSSKLHRYLGFDGNPVSLDSLRADLKSRSLGPARLLQHCSKVRGVPSLSILYGNMLREQAEYIQPDDVDHLLEVASASFDICIVEVSAYWDNAATVRAMLQADERIVITTPDLTHFQEDMHRWLRTSSQLFSFPMSSFLLVVNQMEKVGGNGCITPQDIGKESGMQMAAVIPRYSGMVEQLNQGRLGEVMSNGEHPLTRSLMPLAEMLMERTGMERSFPRERKAWLKRLLPEANIRMGGG